MDWEAAMIHELKTWPEFYDHLVSGRKTFELRRNDRGFRENDTLHLREYDPTTRQYTGREMHRVVTYMLSTNMHSDFVVMALAPLPNQAKAEAARLRAALAPFQPGAGDGIWGRIKAFIVNGAPTREEGIAIARQITEWQCAIDEAALASSGTVPERPKNG
jgi:hypothetical protein